MKSAISPEGRYNVRIGNYIVHGHVHVYICTLLYVLQVKKYIKMLKGESARSQTHIPTSPFIGSRMLLLLCAIIPALPTTPCSLDF